MGNGSAPLGTSSVAPRVSVYASLVLPCYPKCLPQLQALLRTWLKLLKNTVLRDLKPSLNGGSTHSCQVQWSSEEDFH